MLESTFIHCPGIGPKTERALWKAGALHWLDYLSMSDSLRVTRRSQWLLSPLVEESVARLSAADYAWFARTLPPREHWRAYPVFRERTAFLDIETTGGRDGGLVTVIGVYDGTSLRQYIRGVDLNLFPVEIQRFSALVTFFGTGFDLPVLRRAFGMGFPQLHIDLCFLLKRLGYSGGLNWWRNSLVSAGPNERAVFPDSTRCGSGGAGDGEIDGRSTRFSNTTRRMS